MRPGKFDYVAPSTIDEAIELLATRDDAIVLAGGQSLIPLLVLRLARPALLVDINRLPGLSDISRADGQLKIGALCRHRRLEIDEVVRAEAPLLTEAVKFVGSPAIRNRGTLGGSVSHADPVSELPTALVALDAMITVRSDSGSRTIAAADFYVGFMTTARTEGELVTEVTVPMAEPGDGSAFVEFALRLGDFAVAGVAINLALDSSGCSRLRAAGAGLGATPVDLGPALRDVLGERTLGDSLLRSVAAKVGAEIDPPADVHGSSEYRRELAQVLTVQALRLAWERAASGTMTSERANR